MNDQARNSMLAVSVGLIAGVGLLVGIGAIVTNALLPVSAKTDGVSEALARIERKVEALDSKVSGIDGKMSTLRLAGAEQPRPQAPQQPQMPPRDTMVYDIPVADSYVFGNPKAPVTIVEFSDLQCPFCSRFHTPLFEAAKAFPNDVKVILKNFPLPFHEKARPAAKAALAAGLQGKYYEMVNELLANQTSLSDEKFKEVAGKIGLNVDKFSKDLASKDAEFEAKLTADMELGSKVNVEGTPTYYLNGKKSDSRTADMWKVEIKAALAAGKK